MNIDMQPVTSSQIHALGYDADIGVLAIQFKSKGDPGLVYNYANVTPEVFGALKGAESIGSYFGKHIKSFPEKYPFTKQEAAPKTDIAKGPDTEIITPPANRGDSVVASAPLMPAMIDFNPDEFLPEIGQADNLIAQAGRMTCGSQNDFAKGGDLVKLLRSLRAKIEDARTSRVKPHNDYVRELNVWFKQHTRALDVADEAVVQKMDAWRRAENNRLAAEQREAQRRRDEEALAKATEMEKAGKPEEAEKIMQKAIDTPAPKVEVTKVRGSFGSVAGSRKGWRIKVLNLRMLPDACVNAIMANDKALDAIRVALKPLTDAAIASGIEIIGLAIKQEDETNVR